MHILEMMTEKGDKPMLDKIRKSFSYIMLAILYIFIVVFFGLKGKLLINSDVSSEMILAQLLNEKGGFLTQEWHYSSELRVLNTQIIYKFGLLLSPNNWHVARTISVAIFLLILIVGACYLMWTVGHKDLGPWLAIACILPLGLWYGWNVVFDSYYVPHIAISLFSLGLFIRTNSNIGKKEKNITLVLLLLLSLLAGLGGVRQLMICYAPLFVSALCLFLKKIEASERKENLYLFISATAVLILAGLGYIINFKIFQNRYAFLSFRYSTWSDFSLQSIIDCISEYIMLFGWRGGLEVLSLDGLANVFCFLFGALSAGLAIWLLLKWREYTKQECLLIGFFSFAFIIQILVFSHLFNYNESYWVPTLPFAFAVILLYIKTRWSRIASTLLIAIYVVGLLICSKVTIESPYFEGMPNSVAIQPAAEWIIEKGYTQGYGAFWSSNILTELSDGKIEMWTVNNFDEFSTQYDSLQKMSHYTEKPKGKVFFIIDWPVYDSNEELKARLGDRLLYQDGAYVICEFDDVSEYEQMLTE